MLAPTDGPVAHRVRVTELTTWYDEYLGLDPRAGVSTLDWLATPTQRFAEVTGGAVFHDGVGELTATRDRLRWYPDDVWRYLLACQWGRIAQEEHFVGRAAEAGDELGSRVLAARLVRDVLRLVLLLARRFAPYGKWLGRAVAALPAAAEISATLQTALTEGADQRQAALCTAYEAAGGWQNRLGLAEPVDATRRGFHDRPYQIIDADRFAAALRARITDPGVAGLPPIGGIDRYADSTPVLSGTAATAQLRRAMTRAWACPNSTGTS